MQASPTRSGNPALQQGILFGVILAVVSIVINLVNIFALHGSGGALSYISLIIAILLYVFAGFRASAQTGRVGTGALAGLFAGLFSTVISGIVSLILAFAATDLLRQQAQTQAQTLAKQFGTPVVTITNQSIISSTLIGILFAIVLAVAIGAGLGAIGGLIGRRRAPQPQQYQESMYQGTPPTPPSANNY